MTGIVAAEKRVLVRTREFYDITPEEILEILRCERFTGNMTVNFSQGGVCSVRAEDRASISHLTGSNNSQ